MDSDDKPILTKETTKAAARALQMAGRDFPDGVLGLIVLFDEQGNIGLVAPSGVDASAVLRAALACREGVSPAYEGELGPLS